MGEQEEGEEGGEKNNNLQTQRRKIHHRKGETANNQLSLVESSSSPLSKGHSVMNSTASCVSCGRESGRWSLLIQS